MMTYFEDFKTALGHPVCVEYSFSSGSETTYSPHSGADGGDGCEVDIVGWNPNTTTYQRLCLVELQCGSASGNVFMRAAAKVILAVTLLRIKFIEFAVRPTDADFERFRDWIAEHHVYEPPDFEDDYR